MFTFSPIWETPQVARDDPDGLVERAAGAAALLLSPTSHVKSPVWFWENLFIGVKDECEAGMAVETANKDAARMPWWARRTVGIVVVIVSACGAICSGASRIWVNADPTLANVLLWVGLVSVALCVILQGVITAAKDKTVEALVAKVDTAKAIGIQEALAEVRREIQYLAKVSGRGWTPEGSEDFQVQVVELAARLLNSAGIPSVRVCFFIAATPEVQPGTSTSDANIQALTSFHHSAMPGRHAPTVEHLRTNDKYGMFKLLKDGRISHVKKRTRVPKDHPGWRSAVRVGVIGRSPNRNKSVPWGVLTADSLEEYAFPESSDAILELVAALIVMARTAESATKPDVEQFLEEPASGRLGSSVNGLEAFAQKVG
ncbi:hypothetical protein BJG92_03167 [Arthrobacter sp. SO5]|uniref:hypothetical protein n=1 Tax=Arthrobacter sp. SO5 TaxID=1897055 RepID=UPI001E607EB3|nr:hypothetical protein [Arthrobacter sp. SO5]MCB5275616.1 hypothetical protein [Arthrobacter sp. SO5]